jgi:hypothetical protein
MAVAFLARQSNWGPPISGRFDTDFHYIWAAADKALEPSTLNLLADVDQYWHPKIWSDRLTFDPVSDIDGHRLYFLSSPGHFSEFALRLTAASGARYYDNNGGFGLNYRIAPRSGRTIEVRNNVDWMLGVPDGGRR